MNTALIYTLQPGDTLESIIADINSVAGVSAKQIIQQNPRLATTRPHGANTNLTVIKIFSHSDNRVLKYKLLSGDTAQSIAEALNLCSGVTIADLLQDNPKIRNTRLIPGMQIAIPAVRNRVRSQPSAPQLPASEYLIVDWIFQPWQPQPNSPQPPNRRHLLYTGVSDIQQALTMFNNSGLDHKSANTLLCLGGGDGTGHFNPCCIYAIADAINKNRLSDYQGVALYLVEGATGLSEAINFCSASAKANGLQVLVLWHHSAPECIEDASQLVTDVLGNADIDYLCPLLFHHSKQEEHNYQCHSTVAWQQYRQCKPKLLPGILSANLREQALAFCQQHGLTVSGYLLNDF